MTPLTADTVGPVYRELREMLPPGSRLGLNSDGVTLHLDLILIGPDHRGQGIADEVVRRLCEIADANGWPLSVRPTADFGSDLARLRRWYARHGFKGTGRTMYR